MAWSKVPLSAVLREVSEPVSVDPAAKYPNLGLHSFARGAFFKPPIDGAQTSAKTLFRVRAGQLIYSRLFAFEGAYTVVPDDMDGFFVSNEFPVFEHDADRVDVRFLRWLLTNPAVWQEIAMGSKGLVYAGSAFIRSRCSGIKPRCRPSKNSGALRRGLIASPG